MSDVLLFKDENGNECKDFFKSTDIINHFSTILMNTNFSVYAISGDWGTGKTCFIKMWENLISNEGKRFIHIDAYKMDYETEPFMMLIKAFKEFIDKNGIDEKKNKEWLEKAKNIFTIKNIGKLGLNILLEKTIGSETVKDFISNIYSTYFDELSKEQSLYDELRISLQNITENFKECVYIIIDELDRCRPDFALETLERIKHIFNVKNVKFILVYNEEVIKCMIKKRYGSDIDTKRYIDKFIQKTYELDNAKYFIYGFNNIVNTIFENRNSRMAVYLTSKSHIMTEIKNKYQLTFRDINMILFNLVEYQNLGSDNECTVFTTIEILKRVNEIEYSNIMKYYKDNKKIFEENEPKRENFINIFNLLKPQFLTHTPDEAFYYVVDFYNK